MVTVRRIVPNIGTGDIAGVVSFYQALFGLDVVMDHGWIVTLASDQAVPAQIGIATEGGSGMPVPDLSIEVDDVDMVWNRARGPGAPILLPLTDEPWGVRRFFLRDPAGKVLNILSHSRA